MSYDIYFLSRRDGQSWDEVLKAMEETAEDGEPIPTHLLDAWDRIVPQARTLLGEVEITEYEQESRDLVVVALLRRLRGHVPLVLVTNATLELERDLEAMGLADLADHVVSSARVGVAKPDREIYEIAAERAGVAAHRCLFVDDLWENVEAATTLGMIGVHYQGPADLQKMLGFLPGS